MAVTKCDLPRLDEEGNERKAIDFKKLSKKLGIEILPISSVQNEGIDALKDALWTELNKEQNQVIEISHAPIDVKINEEMSASLNDEMMEEEGTIYLNEVEEEWDLSKYRGIGWDEQN